MDGDQVGLISMTPQQCEEFVHEWREKLIYDSPRRNLSISDGKWEYIYQACPRMRADKDSLIFRAHHGGEDEPVIEEYADRGIDQKVTYDEEHRRWVEHGDLSNIRFDGHWVSFTKKPEVLCKPYFAEKGLRGFVIILRVDKGVDISEIPARMFLKAEQEVVAPMDRSNLVEILPFDKFKQKYCKRDGQ